MVRFFIKGISFLAALLLAVIPALFWLPTGSWLVLPATQYFGEKMSPQIKVERVEGSLWEGYSVAGLEIVSGDETYLSLARAAASPDWGLILAGNPWLKSLEVEGLSSDIGHLQSLAEHFGGEKEEESSSSLSIRPMPLNLSIRDVNLASPQANLRLSSLLLDEGGYLSLQARANDVPVEGEARIGFEPLTLISSDMNVGTGHLSMKGSLEPPLDFRADLVALSIETLLALVPDPPVRAAGRLDGRVLLKSSRSDFSDPLSGLPVGLSASGVLSVPRGIVEDIPLSLRVPWSWKDGVFSISEASLRTKAAEAALDASVDLRRGLDAALVTLKGDAKNISLREIGRIAAPEAGLAGEGGQLHFDLSAGLDGDLGRIAGGLSLRLPEVSATGLQALSQQKIRLVKGLNADLRLKPGNAPELSCSGEVFGGRLSGRGEVERRGESLRPSAVLSLDGVDLAALVAAIPDLKGLKPSGRVSLNARVAEDLSVTGRVTSSRLSIAGVTLQDLATDLDYRGGTAGARLSLGKFLAEGVAVQDIDSNFSYNTENGRAVLDYLTGQVGRGGSLSASGTANVKAQSLDFRAAMRSLDPRSIPQLKSSGFQGLCDLEATVGGTFADPDVSARLRGRNNSVANVSLGNLDLSASYAKHQLSVPETRLKLPGGTLVFGGTVGLADPSNPRLDIAAATTTMNLAQISRALKLKEPVTGIVQGNVRIKGPLRTASAAVHLRADDVRTGEVRIAHATLNARGDRGQLNIDKLDAVIGAPGGADAHITGKGRIAAGKKDLMDSAVNLGLTVRGLELRPLLNRFAVNAPVGGTLNGNVNVKGTLARPTLDMKVVSPLSVSQFIIDTLSLSVRSPARDRYALAASAKIGELNLALDGDVRKQQKGWDYTFTTKPLDVAKLLAVFAPSAKGLASGQVRARVNGSAPGTGPIGVRVSLPKLILMDKVTVEDITLPISVSMQDNRVSIREAQAILSEGLIRAKVDVDLAASSW
ncbi:MAG: hypothetical protein IJU98_08365 [Synergistaceae bacterium]|nr:hypothetical protein [Synergistaceae bacterium]